MKNLFENFNKQNLNIYQILFKNIKFIIYKQIFFNINKKAIKKYLKIKI